MEELYEAIEKAAAQRSKVTFPKESIGKELRIGDDHCFFVPGLYWMDELRNVYVARLEMNVTGKDLWSVGLYVAGSTALDGRSSGDTSMFRKENRYRSVI